MKRFFGAGGGGIIKMMMLECVRGGWYSHCVSSVGRLMMWGVCAIGVSAVARAIEIEWDRDRGDTGSVCAARHGVDGHGTQHGQVPSTCLRVGLAVGRSARKRGVG